MDSRAWQRAVVVGSGMMGPGIAFSLAAAGLEVKLYGRSEQSAGQGGRRFERLLALLREAGCIADDKSSAVKSLVTVTSRLEEAAADADLIIESIPEDLLLKQQLFGRLEACCPASTVMTSNTSGLPATRLAKKLQHPERFAVTHFWNPPHLMPLVEIVRGERTAASTAEALVALMKRAGKKPVTVHKDMPGQLGNRLLHALTREAIYLIEQGVASAEDVDIAIKNGLGRRFPVYGAMEHADVVGLDMVLAIQEYLCSSLCNAHEPARILRQKAAAGDLGRKSGKGFYDWSRRDAQAVIDRRDRFLLELLKAEQEAGSEQLDDGSEPLNA
jgi:3-hydroxybutyryl-CoA dehydrogenase